MEGAGGGRAPGGEAESETALVAGDFLALRRARVASGEWRHQV